jgi:hypothetical protein
MHRPAPGPAPAKLLLRPSAVPAPTPRVGGWGCLLLAAATPPTGALLIDQCRAQVRHLAGVGGQATAPPRQALGSRSSINRPERAKAGASSGGAGGQQGMGSVHGASAATVEEEAELDQALEDMFEQDASRLFWLNRIPRALTSG